jgi:hypothetical protein
MDEGNGIDYAHHRVMQCQWHSRASCALFLIRQNRSDVSRQLVFLFNSARGNRIYHHIAWYILGKRQLQAVAGSRCTCTCSPSQCGRNASRNFRSTGLHQCQHIRKNHHDLNASYLFSANFILNLRKTCEKVRRNSAQAKLHICSQTRASAM